jgi:hypothetical protein
MVGPLAGRVHALPARRRSGRGRTTHTAPAESSIPELRTGNLAARWKASRRTAGPVREGDVWNGREHTLVGRRPPCPELRSLSAGTFGVPPLLDQAIAQLDPADADTDAVPALPGAPCIGRTRRGPSGTSLG